ncbi:MAG: SRPBCC family protein, partial [Phycisphaerales bacterium]|nr:SRPBCC family protein [Phycisphaerales bacterium]
MAQIVVEKLIHAPVERVFARCTDLASLPEIVSGIDAIEVLTEGAVGDGTAFRETRTMLGREATEEMTFTEFDPPRGYVLLAESCGSRYRSVHSFEPADGGTRVRMEFSATPVSLTAKILSPVLGLVFKKTLMKCLNADFDDLKRA